MKTLKLAEAKHDLTERNVLRRNRPLGRVLFATDGRGTVVRLDSVGDVTEYVAEAPGEFVDEVKDHPFPGLWIWEGVIRAHHYNTPDANEWDVWLEGTVRPLSEDERGRLREDDDPWDRSLWYEETL